MNREEMNPEWKQFVRALKGHRCEICGEGNCGASEPEKRLQIHHKLPVRAGGEDTISNLMLLCPTCHLIEEDCVHTFAHAFKDLIKAAPRPFWAVI